MEVNARTCIEFLYVSESRLTDETGKRMLGLYSSKSLTKGDFIGLYTGKWYEEPIDLSPVEEKYTLSTGRYVIVPDIEFGKYRPDPVEFPMAMANEPLSHKRANSTFIPLEIVGSDVIGGNESDLYEALGLFACQNIRAHTEIVWNYGATYKRSYEVGKFRQRPHTIRAERSARSSKGLEK